MNKIKIVRKINLENNNIRLILLLFSAFMSGVALGSLLLYRSMILLENHYLEIMKSCICNII